MDALAESKDRTGPLPSRRSKPVADGFPAKLSPCATSALSPEEGRLVGIGRKLLTLTAA